MNSTLQHAVARARLRLNSHSDIKQTEIYSHEPLSSSSVNPQDAAWLGAFRYAQKSIFIQSPTLNAKPAIDGIISACQRGIRVIVWIDLGFNDLTEGHGTLQGGTNERVIKKTL